MNRSESIAKLAEALAKAQGAMENAKLTAANPFFHSKYAPLSSVWDAARKPLSDNGLAVIQTTIPTPEGLVLETVLSHSSGEWISSTYPIRPVKDDPQGVGSALTYARRYSFAAIVGMVADEDDDANGASGKEKQKPVAKGKYVDLTETHIGEPLPPANRPSAPKAKEPDEGQRSAPTTHESESQSSPPDDDFLNEFDEVSRELEEKMKGDTAKVLKTFKAKSPRELAPPDRLRVIEILRNRIALHERQRATA